MSEWSVYIVKCSDDSLYTGITTNIRRRMEQHNSKKGSRSLFGKLPVTLVYREKVENQTAAAKREREIKGWRKEKKLLLITKGLP